MCSLKTIATCTLKDLKPLLCIAHYYEDINIAINFKLDIKHNIHRACALLIVMEYAKHNGNWHLLRTNGMSLSDGESRIITVVLTATPVIIFTSIQLLYEGDISAIELHYIILHGLTELRKSVTQQGNHRGVTYTENIVYNQVLC